MILNVKFSPYVHLQVSSVTDPGCRRPLNEDAVLVKPAASGGLFAVADGMGGHNAGDFASYTILQEIEKSYAQDFQAVPQRLITSVEAASHIIQKLAHAPDKRGMGSTLVAMAIEHGHAWILNIGDSRVYLFRNRALVQITRDHSWVAEQVRAGILNADEAREHSMRSVLTNALGRSKDPLYDLHALELLPEDRMIICSDGLTSMLSDEQIANILKENPTVEEQSKVLVREAKKAGGLDNVTVILIEVVDVLSNKKTLPFIELKESPQKTQHYLPQIKAIKPPSHLRWLWLVLFGVILIAIEVVLLNSL